MSGYQHPARHRRALRQLFVLAPSLFLIDAPWAGADCPAAQPEPQLPADPALCQALAPIVRAPGTLPLDAYERKLDDFLSHWCHRDSAAGWVRDKRVRDTGPFIASRAAGEDGQWSGSAYGTHGAVLIWYSPEMIAWMQRNRPAEPKPGGQPTAEPVPDGAIMVKEMYPSPAARCAEVPPERLKPSSGAAVMVRDRQASKDGWFWGWYDWTGWTPDWPAGPSNRLAYMGFGQYCMNCHASASDSLTFADLKNVAGYGGQPNAYLVQDWFERQRVAPAHHERLTEDADDALPIDQPRKIPDPAIIAELPGAANGANGVALARIDPSAIALPSQTYDNVWMPADGPAPHSQYLTSDQCLGCHDAGGTGLQFDMTAPDPHGDRLLNLSPYGTWRSSPMGLAGRDPVFFAQLASETQRFHPDQSDLVQTTCLGCHGILGQRQWQIDKLHAANGTYAGDACAAFERGLVDAVPYPPDAPSAAHASYGALARDGISCMACHHMVLGEAASRTVGDQPQNHCVKQRQQQLNPDANGFARTFTGSFLVGPPDRLYGPFEAPKPKPMQQALGITPEHNATIQSSEACGTCHTVHLPVLHQGATIAQVYEQTTYPEWAFSAYRTGDSPDGALPHGAGTRAQSCQGCHMPSSAPDGTPYRSKIAAIQELSGFPATENTLPAEAIDLPERDSFARHTLVGLNVFLIEMFQQFPDVLGMRTQDPMMVGKGVEPLLRTESAMLDQGAHATAVIGIEGIPKLTEDRLSAQVSIENLAGHKFPSGVGFRRAFVAFEVLDANGRVLWASGRTNGAGLIVDAAGKPIPGELWWRDDCSARVAPEARAHQPHYQVIDAEDQAQIYQELVSAPPMKGPTTCGHDATPAGELTTSFLSICAEVKDNRILPHGYLSLAARTQIANALGAGPDLAADAGPTATGDDPDYVRGGADRLSYQVARSELGGQPASVRATLYYQATPPFFLQDRFCTATGSDAERLRYLTAHLDLGGTAAENWKLKLVSTGAVAIGVEAH